MDASELQVIDKAQARVYILYVHMYICTCIHTRIHVQVCAARVHARASLQSVLDFLLLESLVHLHGFRFSPLSLGLRRLERMQHISGIHKLHVTCIMICNEGRKRLICVIIPDLRHLPDLARAYFSHCVYLYVHYRIHIHD